MTTSVGALSFAPLTATEGSLGVSVRVGDTLEATEFTFTNIQEAEWPAGGEYWLRLRVIEDGTAIGFIAPMADRKVVVDVGPLQMLLDGYTTASRPLDLQVEWSLAHCATDDADAVELATSAPMTLSIR